MTVDPTISEDKLRADAFDNEPAANPTVTATRVSGTNSDREVEAPEGSAEGAKLVETDFYNIQDGTRGRLGGVYLDRVEQAHAEQYRALSEGREPDYKDMPATAGTQLVTEARQVDNVYSNPSSAVVAPLEEVEPHATLPVDVGIATTETDVNTLQQHLDEAEARNESLDNEPTGTTVETGATPENPEDVNANVNPNATTYPTPGSYGTDS